ncbi:trimethylamine methyltransferase family protein [Neomoorella thermoacetica]|uniref:trimethylamine methyltransferase family protein n=1 Tax=Neomoorella thermoacetica TaxID=1525 RepID=UPI0008FAEFBC|nr:trimethylamine methyltransferase family protein [Moorella thermoacetica]OIQ59367.1 trimethylamine methyltransferase (MTTB) [Moorella thermoacetica]
METFKLLGHKDVDYIYNKSISILSKKGVKITHANALSILEKAGAAVDFKNQMVYFSRNIIERALAEVPEIVTLTASESAYDIVISRSQNGLYSRTNTGACYYVDIDGEGYRDIKLSDIAELGQLVDALQFIDFCAYQVPADAPPQSADIYALKTLLENTSKHVWVQPYSMESVRYLIELSLARCGHQASSGRRPPISLIACSLTPLCFKDLDMEIILQGCKFGIPIHLCSLPTSGGTAPFTVAGFVLMASTEILAMAVIAQLIKSGTPVIATPLSFTLDMMTTMACQSTVEAILGAAASTQFIKSAYNLPTHTYGFGSDTAITDGQGIAERTLLGAVVALSGVDIMGGAGQVETAKTLDPVTLVIDNELAGMSKILRKEITVDDEALALDDIFELSFGNDQFLTREHTLRHCRETFRPINFLHFNREIWLAKGGKEFYSRALEKYRAMKKDFGCKPLTKEVKQDMENIIAEADKHLCRI